MNNPFRLFCIHREERPLAATVLTLLVVLNALVLARYYAVLTPLSDNYWQLFIGKFHVSGFDPITLSVVSDWMAGYNVYRHPLLAFYMYPLYLVNQGLISLTGHNCAIFVVAAMQIVSAFYAQLFFYRIVRHIVGLSRCQATVLTLFFLSFAYVMLSAMVPDHFVISMMLLLLTLYVSGRSMRQGREMGIGQTVVLFLLTAGVSLNNGLKTFLSALFTRGRRFFRWRYLLLAVLIPAALLWRFSRFEYARLVWPREVAQHAEKKKKREAARQRAEAQRTARAFQDSLDTARGDTAAVSARRASDAAAAAKKRARRAKQGKPLGKGEFLRWTDISTSRTESIVENLFGESIQLHPDHLLADTLRQRPVIVHYRWWWNYAVEGLIAVLFLVGIWLGRRDRFLWLVLSCFALDMALHIGLGFGINEVYIMSAHWIFAIPIAVAYLLKSVRRRWPAALLALLALYLFIYNIELFTEYFLF